MCDCRLDRHHRPVHVVILDVERVSRCHLSFCAVIKQQDRLRHSRPISVVITCIVWRHMRNSDSAVTFDTIVHAGQTAFTNDWTRHAHASRILGLILPRMSDVDAVGLISVFL